MDALFAAIESTEAGPAPKRRRVTKKEASAETQALIDRLTAEEGLTVEGARKLRTGDVRCRPPTYASFARPLPQFRLRSVEDAARAEDIVMFFVHVHGDTMQRDKFRFNVDNYLNDAKLRASVAELKTLEDLQAFCKSRYGRPYGNQRIYGDAPEERYRRMLAGSVHEETPEETIRDVIACMVTVVEQNDKERRDAMVQGMLPYDIKYQRVDLHEGLPDRLARIVKLGAGGAALSGTLVIELLASATQHLPMSTVTMQKPPIGAMFVFERGTTRFKQDGHDWDIETHNSLVTYFGTGSLVDNRITNYYAQSRAGNIQRRCYWDRKDGANGRFVFVHYVKPPAPGSRLGRLEIPPLPQSPAVPALAPAAAALALTLALAAAGPVPTEAQARCGVAVAAPPAPAPTRAGFEGRLARLGRILAAGRLPNGQELTPQIRAAIEGRCEADAATMLADIKAIFQAPNTRIGTAIMRLAPITAGAAAGPDVGRDVCTVAAFLSGTKASDDEKNLHFGEIKELVLANRWNDALEYIRTVARTL